MELTEVEVGQLETDRIRLCRFGRLRRWRRLRQGKAHREHQRDYGQDTG